MDKAAASPPSDQARRPSIAARTESGSSMTLQESDESQGYFSPEYSDTARLTADIHLQQLSAAGPSTPVGQRQAQGSFQSIRFLTPEAASTSRVSGDLSAAEAGLRTPEDDGPRRSQSRIKSLSPSAASPLQRAGTIVKNMSQRVVNLTNEPELVERSMKRKSSLKSTPTVEPPSPRPLHGTHDGASSPAPDPPPERMPSLMRQAFIADDSWQKQANPFKGNSLGVFPPEHPLRTRLCDLLVHPVTEPCLFIMIVIQTILLAIDSGSNVFDDPRSKSWGTSWIDYGLLILFVIYTAEIVVRIIVSGFIINPVEYSTINRRIGVRQAVFNKAQSLFTPQRQPSVKRADTTFDSQQPSILRAFTTTQMHTEPSGGSQQLQRVRLAQRAFLRHSFNRLDFIAVVSFWISFVMGLRGVESSQHAYVFRMLSCLRILRLLRLTSGTTVILRSLKKAAPLLLNVSFLIGFFWLLFAIVGVQSFKSSLRRNCVWVDPNGRQDNYTNEFQFCGGHLDQNSNPLPWVFPDGRNGTLSSKGFLCPKNSFCVQGDNPYSGTVSFDNLVQSLELIFVVMTTNTFTELMYYLTDSDYLAAALFFAFGIVIMSLWLINLLIAVITSSFQVIRDESNTSAFTAHEADEPPDNEDEKTPKRRISSLKRMYERTYWLWIAIIVYGLSCQSMRSADMSRSRERFIDVSELGVTLVLLFEIAVRFTVDWRRFFRSKRNWVDLGLAIITTIIQLPKIRNFSQPYAWLTLFQILRIYRVVLAIPMTRDLIMVVLGNVSGLANMILFVFLLTFLAAIFAAQLLRGELPESDGGEPLKVTFATIYNSFLGMYQILSSENWTTILYSVTSYNVKYNTAWIGASFLIIWYILSNFIVLNMFIAVIQENFDVSEDEKRLQQVKAFLQQKELGGSSHGNLSLSTIFKIRQHTGRRKDPLEYGSHATEMLLKDAVVKDFLDDPGDPAHQDTVAGAHPTLRAAPTTIVSSGVVSSLWSRVVASIFHHEPNPFYARLEFSRAYEDLDPRQMAKEVVTATDRRKKAQREYLLKHPNYNVSLFMFGPYNPVRKFCQRIVGPGRGSDRIEGVPPSVPVWYAFSAFIYAAIVAMVLLACVTTPLYQKEYFSEHKFSVKNWFVFTDLGFAILFSVEALIKIIADGFFWTPNAYFRGSWGFIDGVVLITLWVNVGTSLYKEGNVSRAVGAFKALRALRLLNISDSARDTFHSVIVRGGWKVLSAAFVSLSLLIPFAIYGLNLFHGQMQACNDNGSGIFDLHDCVGEYLSSPYGWDLLFILFQIVSQEGWTDVMWRAESITGVFTQPKALVAQGNAVFFVIFNLLGAVFVLTLFVSVFMRNYTEQTAIMARVEETLAADITIKTTFIHQKKETWEEWCYRRAVSKTGWWQRSVTGVLILHLTLLCLEFYPAPWVWERTRGETIPLEEAGIILTCTDYLFLAFTVLYIVNIAVRMIGLTWPRFRKSSWDVYSIFAVFGTFTTTILLLTDFNERIFVQLHKLCLVSIALLLIPRNNQLDQLFKTAAASLTSIGNLLATWFVLFLVFAIALTQAFGLTRFNANESDNINFRTVPKALILLFRTSSGEGWNQIMEDFATIEPPFCVKSDQHFDSDCGSAEWARALFITWNIVSVYIFVNLFVSLIYESFSYVYQRSSGLSVVSREEIRRFKQAWAEFDPNGTGYISKEKFPRLLGELSGLFEMRIYDGDFSVRRLIEDCSVAKRISSLPVDGTSTPPEIDIRKLNARLAELPISEIRRRRQRMNIFYEEVLVSADPDRGISFNSLLMILAHYKVINDNKSLRLEEFLRRKARLQFVEEAVKRSVVVGFFDTLYRRRRFQRVMDTKRAGRMTAVPRFTVPEIYVDDEDIHYDDGSSAGHPTDSRRGSDARSVSPPADPAARSRANTATSIQITPTHSPTRGLSPSRSSPQGSPSARAGGADGAADWHPVGGLNVSRPPSPLEPGEAGRSRANSNVSAQDVLEVLDNSAWGESIRRSFTVRRPSQGDR
ncbi:calcium channel protein [Coniosporium tulheliwenetii]|uniref:Calcium channel protein n=1 Tax=Coniosporium tulheliwenetii TaxID=3383036 RepID=A0ACC2ZK55_9PEZI|nr:calcium channel protein [Cladosporium sp. JES 115]